MKPNPSTTESQSHRERIKSYLPLNTLKTLNKDYFNISLYPSVPSVAKYILFSLCLCVSVVFCGLAVSASAEEPFKYNTRNKRDPFVPLVTKDGRIIITESESSDDPSGMRLEGILYDTNGESIAVLNGKIVRKGDRVGNYEVAQVGRYDITLLDSDTNSIILKLKDDIEQKEEYQGGFDGKTHR